MPSLADALFAKTRQKVLGILFARPGRALHLRELARLAGVTPSSIQRELQGLVAAGVLLRESRGAMHEFRANPDCPLYDELCGFARKTYGIADQVRNAFADLPIDVALIFGSVARGNEHATSDVDVLLIGEHGYRDALSRAQGLEPRLGRPINIKFYKRAEFQDLVSANNAFVQQLLTGPTIPLKGDVHGFQASKSAQPRLKQSSSAPRP
jgi:predicted nucleotidyltransferase